jgi:single-stranded DNA-binding protein
MKHEENDLNSLLIEGYLVGDPIAFTNDEDEIERCAFTIRTVSLRKDHSDFFDIQIDTFDTLAPNVFEYLRKNNRVRIVGRIYGEEDGIHIEAEHVENVPARRVFKSITETANA